MEECRRSRLGYKGTQRGKEGAEQLELVKGNMEEGIQESIEGPRGILGCKGAWK